MRASLQRFTQSSLKSHRAESSSSVITGAPSKNLQRMLKNMPPDSQVKLIDTLGDFILRLSDKNTHPGDANTMVAYLTGDLSSALPTHIKTQEIFPGTAKSLKKELTRGLQVRSPSPEDSRANLEQLLVDLLTLFKPAHHDWFERIFLIQDQPNVFQPQKIDLSPKLSSALTDFKKKVLDEVAGGDSIEPVRPENLSRESISDFDSRSWNPRFSLKSLRMNLLEHSVKKDCEPLNKENVTLAREAVLRAFFCDDSLFGLTNHVQIKSPQYRTMDQTVSWLLSEEVLPEVANDVEKRLLAPLAFRKHARTEDMLLPRFAETLLNLAFGSAQPPVQALDATVLKRIQDALLNGLLTQPPMIRPDNDWFDAAFKPAAQQTDVSSITRLQSALLIYIRREDVPESEIRRSACNLLLDAREDDHVALTMPEHRANLDELRQYLMTRLQNTLMSRTGGFVETRASNIMYPNGFARMMLDREHARPPALQLQLDTLLFELFAMGKLTEPDDIGKLAKQVCTGEIDLKPLLPVFEQHGFDFLTKAIEKHGIGLQEILKRSVDWMPAQHIAQIAKNRQLFIPENKQVVMKLTEKRFAQEFAQCALGTALTEFKKIDYDTWAIEQLAAQMEKHAPALPVPDKLYAQLLSVLRDRMTAHSKSGTSSAAISALLAEHLPRLDQHKSDDLALALESIKIEDATLQSLLAHMPLVGTQTKARLMADNALAMKDERFADVKLANETSLTHFTHELEKERITAHYDQWIKENLSDSLVRRAAEIWDLDRYGTRSEFEFAVSRIIRDGVVRPTHLIGFYNVNLIVSIVNILNHPRFERNIEDKKEAIFARLHREDPEHSVQPLREIAEKIVGLDKDEVREKKIIQIIGVSAAGWQAMRAQVLGLLKTWKQWPLFFAEEALKTHLERRQDVVEMIEKLRGTEAFEPYVLATLPFLRRPDLGVILAKIDSGELHVATDFHQKLKAAKAYFDWMAPALGIEVLEDIAEDTEEIEDDLLKFLVCSVDGDEATFLRMTDLLTLNRDNQTKGKVLDEFKAIEFNATSPGKNMSNVLTMNFLRKADLPAYLEEMLGPCFSIAPIIAETMMELLLNNLKDRGLSLTQQQTKVLEDIVHRTAMHPGGRVSTPISQKKELLSAMEDGHFGIAATQISDAFSNLESNPGAEPVGPLRGWRRVGITERRENLVKLTLTSPVFLQGLTPRLMAELDRMIENTPMVFAEHSLDKKETPNLQDVQYMFAMLFAELSSANAIGYYDNDIPVGNAQGIDGMREGDNIAGAQFRLMAAHCLAKSLSQRPIPGAENHAAALCALEFLVRTVVCSGIISDEMRIGVDRTAIGVRALALLNRHA